MQSCEMAGPGFKFIPGTQTCIRISGHVQYEINVKNN
ncbi:porin [Ahrensia kielensis]